MSSFLLQMAEFVYNWEAAIIFIAGIAVSVLLWCIDSQRTKKQIRAILVASVILVTCLLSAYILHVNKTYAYLPEVNYNHYSFQYVETMLAETGFNIATINYDPIAVEKLKQDEDPYSYYFKVTQMNPEPGTFVKTDTTVTLNIAWKDYFGSASIDISPNTPSDTPDVAPDTPPNVTPDNSANVVPNQNAFDGKAFYGNINPRDLYPFNADEFTLFTSEAALQMVTNKTNFYSLGIHPNYIIPLEIQLINYDTSEIIVTKTAYLGDEVTFSDLPNGTYYYIVNADGYKTFVPDDPFRLEYDASEEKDVLPWSVNLEKLENIYSAAFKVQLCNEQGIPISYTEANVRVVSEDDLSPNQYSCYPVTSNENGYLTIWSETNGVEYYDLVDFYLCDGYRLEICLAGGYEFTPVHSEGDIGLCTISN